MSVVTISQKGWIVIPVQLREKYQLKPGDRVKVVDYGGAVTLVPVAVDPEEEGYGALKRTGSSLMRGLEKARKEERAKEKRRK